MARIYVPDIECDSCVRLISRKLKEKNISNFSVYQDSVEVPDSSKLEASKAISSLGYRNSFEPIERKTFGERLRHMREKKEKYEIEYTGFQYSTGVFLILGGLFLLSYAGILKNIPNFLPRYGWWMLYLIIAVTSLSMGLWHFFAYRAKVTHMVGMMVGMTFGMQTGMMIGAIVGATNGFFIGSMVGMIGGSIVGSLTGKCCGVMGIMEGMMAGLMGGTMGPMITFMMLNDHLLLFMPFYMVINLLIMVGLSYMYYEEVVETEKTVKKPMDFTTLASISVIAMFLLSVLIIYGPKSAIVS